MQGATAKCSRVNFKARPNIQTNPSCETKFLGTNGDREILIFPVQATTNRIGNLYSVDPFSAISDYHTQYIII